MTSTQPITQKNTEEGFSLVETLIAITIILVSVVTPLSIASRAISYANVARDEIVATNLAQEAIEFIRNERDNDALDTNLDVSIRFKTFLTRFGSYDTLPKTGCYSGYGCEVDVSTNWGAAIPRAMWCSGYTGGACRAMTINSVRGATCTPSYVYGYTAATVPCYKQTPYTRTVAMEVNDPANPKEVRIRVDVNWTYAGIGPQSVTLYEYLKPWAPGFI